MQAVKTRSHNKNSTLCPLVFKDTANNDSNIDADFNPPADNAIKIFFLFLFISIFLGKKLLQLGILSSFL